MKIYHGVILGLVQGLTEFLPISSSGHILLAEGLMGVSGGLFFSLALHLGTLLSVVVFMRGKIAGVLKDKTQLKMLGVATIPAGVVGVLFADAVDRLFFGGQFICIGFLITATSLFFCERLSKRRACNKMLNFKGSVALGVAQGVAVIPAISRSGSIFACGVAMGYQKSELADFTFLMSIPIIAGGVVYELLKMLLGGGFIQTGLIMPILFGGLSAFLSGLIALEWTKNAFINGKLWHFALYLCLLSLTIIVVGGI